MQNLLKLFFIKLTKPSGWLNGTFKGYQFEAKVYQYPSPHGIDGGRISKLTIRRQGKIVAHYDRGWDMVPQGLHRKAFERIKGIIG